jgi:hypothetical protein
VAAGFVDATKTLAHSNLALSTSRVLFVTIIRQGGRREVFLREGAAIQDFKHPEALTRTARAHCLQIVLCAE